MMKRYKLLKDLPNLKKGTILSEGKSLFGARTLITKNDVDPIFIGNDLFEEFFKEIQEEPTDSIHWKPQPGDRYWFVDYWGTVTHTKWNNTIADSYNFDSGNTYRTEEKCKKDRNRKLAEVRLRRTSTFEPDFENGKGGWIVGYDHQKNRFLSMFVGTADYGEPVHYKTKEYAEKSIEENREDWLIYFGVKEG